MSNEKLCGRLRHSSFDIRHFIPYHIPRFMAQPNTSAATARPRVALCTEYPIRQHGGTEVLVRELIQGLARDFDLVLVSDDDAKVIEESPFAGKITRHFRWSAGAVSAATSKALARALAEARVDLAHFHFGGNYGWGARQLFLSPVIHLRRLGVPCIATNHGVFNLLDGYIGEHRSLLVKLALLPAAWLGKLQVVSRLGCEIAVSDNDLRALQNRYWPLASKFRRIYHSRLVEETVPPATAREKVIFCAGTIGPRKGQPFLAKAFLEVAAQFPDWKLVFAGRPGDPLVSTELGELVARLPSRIVWLKECSDAELMRWLRGAEIFAMPSMHEGLGLSLQEALYFGCACIASRVGGIQDLLVNEENGLLVPPADVVALAAGLRRLMEDTALRQRFQQRGRAWVLQKDMTAPRMVANYVKLYREFL